MPAICHIRRGYQRFSDKASSGSEGAEIVRNCVTSFMEDPYNTLQYLIHGDRIRQNGSIP